MAESFASRPHPRRRVAVMLGGFSFLVLTIVSAWQSFASWAEPVLDDIIVEVREYSARAWDAVLHTLGLAWHTHPVPVLDDGGQVDQPTLAHLRARDNVERPWVSRSMLLAAA